MNIIDDIVNASMESSINVCDAIIGMIDKNEVIREYDETSCVNDIIMESMMMIMEASADVKKTKDIKKWMESKGYLYKGDNPKKKKESNRLLHFLQMNDFDPKTSTYLSDIKDKNGNKVRLPLHFDGEGGMVKLTPAEEKRKKELIDTYGSLTDWDIDLSDKMNRTVIGKTMAASSLQQGVQSFFAPNRGKSEIYLSPQLTKRKQQLSQGILKHEEGHASDYMTKQGKTSSSPEEIKKIKKDTGKEMAEYRKSGIYVNEHDKDAKERYADAYAAKHSVKRTKNGKRSFNERDLEKHHKMLADMVYHQMAAVPVDTSIEWCNGCIDKCDHLLNQSWSSYNAIDKHSWLSLDEMPNILDRLAKIDSKKASTELLEIIKENEEKSSDKLEALRKSIDDVVSKKKDLEEETKECSEIVEQINYLAKLINLLKDGDKEEFAEKIKNLEKFSTGEMFTENQGKSRLGSKSKNTIVPLITKADIEKLETLPTYEERVAYFQKAKTPTIRRWKKQYENMLESLKEFKKTAGQFKDSSTAVRYSLSKKYIKEYFTELFED